MNTTIYTNALYATAFICTFFSSGLFAESNTNTHNESDYIELCNIYKSIVNKPLDLISKEMKLTENVQNKLPNLFNNLYVYVLNTDADSRYEFIQKFAKLRDKHNWECEIARSYYSTQFGTP